MNTHNNDLLLNDLNINALTEYVFEDKNIDEQDREIAQLELEKGDMRDLTIKRHSDKLQHAKEGQNESQTPAGRALMKAACDVDRLPQAFRDFIEKAKSGKAGRRHAAVKFLELIDADTAAFLTVRSILDTISQKMTLTAAALRVANLIEDEVRYRVWEAEDKQQKERNLEKALKKALKSNNYRHQRNSVNMTMRRKGYQWNYWSQEDKVHVGTKCIDLLIASTKLITIVTHTVGKNNTVKYVEATNETLDWIEQRNNNSALLAPYWLPMICTPKDWDSSLSGGYLSDWFRPNLVRSFSEAYQEELEHSDIQPTYNAVNALQRTGYRVDVRVLRVVKELWERGAAISSLPPRDTLELPPRPHDIDTNEDAKKQWKREAAEVHQENTRLRSKRVSVGKTLWVATKFAFEDRIHFVTTLDFRGRMYYRSPFLSPQGNDLQKGLLLFSEAKRMTEQGACWLAIQGANLYGNDKVTLQERIDWVHENTEAIIAVAENPMDYLDFWKKADKPFMFLQFCFEWYCWLRDGTNHMSRMIGYSDGSCNGLQNFSAMLRDPVGGEAVNLVPNDLPADIYQKVCDVTIKKLEDLSTKGGEDAEIASKWLEYGLSRKDTKKPVMVLPYGGTRFGCREAVLDRLRERKDKGEDHPFYVMEEGERRDRSWLAAGLLAGLIWDSIGEVVVAARQAMDWLQKAARLASKEGLPIHWKTPLGFPVQQAYRNTARKRIKTRLNGQLTWMTVTFDGSEISKNRMANGISPNFVHSLDACHAQWTINLCEENAHLTGEEKGFSYAFVHDSYGCHVVDCELMGLLLRRSFVDMYSNHDVLREFRDNLLPQLSEENAADLPPLPDKGTLDLEQVMESAFFFA